ncbi:MAG TPA: cupin domain-containing protein, partial [Sedimentisphaerales bacterium]|nr:cupin domain-containing protein [Sedimentisphaerales bacterium]
MATGSDKARVSPEVFAKVTNLGDMAAYVSGSIVSKTLIDKPAGTITVFAFDAGQGLSEHTAQYDAFIEVLDGSAGVRIADKWLDVKAGQAVVMPAGVPHEVQARERFKMLLTMIR